MSIVYKISFYVIDSMAMDKMLMIMPKIMVRVTHMSTHVIL